MPNSKSASKRMRQNETRRVRNRLIATASRTEVKKVRTALDAGELDTAKALLPNAVRSLQRAANKGVLHTNTASRKVGRLVKAVEKGANG
ncbi:MAG: small subunit ribosomal protein S20 [Bradymonadia bacterium]|jgi:small subunit ribosomal protein S20